MIKWKDLQLAFGMSDEQMEKYRKNAPAPVPVDESDYWNKVFSQERTKAAVSVQEARSVFCVLRDSVNGMPNGNWNAVEQLYLALIAVGTGIEAIAEKAGVSTKKGLLVIGAVGTGKTTAFQMAKSSGIIRFRETSCFDVSKAVQKNGMDALEVFESGVMYFDDLGIEPEVVSYGTRIDPMESLLHTRYMNYTRHGKLSHFSTNLGIDELAERYGERAISRLLHMSNIIEMGNTTDFRL